MPTEFPGSGSDYPALPLGESRDCASLRILAVGDCNTGGANGCEAGTRVVDQFAARLQAAGYRCEVQNLGYTMSTTREGIARMRIDAQPADLVLINFGLVDAWITSLPRFYLSYYPDSAVKKQLRKLLKSVKRRLRNRWLRPLVPVGEVVPLAEYRRNLSMLIVLARRLHPGCRVILWGTVAVRGNEPRSENIRRYNTALKQVAARTPRTWYLDAPACLNGLAVEDTYIDHLHLSEAGAARISAGLFDLCQRKVLDVPLATAQRFVA